MNEDEIKALFDCNPWIISDIHWHHKNIIKYCDRPLNWEEIFLENIQIIKPDEILINLGDIALCNKEETKAFIELLPKNHYMIRGNHDGRSIDFYKECGIIIIPPFEFATFKFSHRPLEEKELNIYNYPFYTNIHGHIHNKPNISKRHINVSIEVMNYKPIRFSDCIGLFCEKNK